MRKRAPQKVNREATFAESRASERHSRNRTPSNRHSRDHTLEDDTRRITPRKTLARSSPDQQRDVTAADVREITLWPGTFCEQRSILAGGTHGTTLYRATAPIGAALTESHSDGQHPNGAICRNRLRKRGAAKRRPSQNTAYFQNAIQSQTWREKKPSFPTSLHRFQTHAAAPDRFTPPSPLPLSQIIREAAGQMHKAPHLP